MHSLTEENYLKALYNLSGTTGEVNINELAQQLSVKMPTASSMIKKLAEKELVHYESYKPVSLTTEGKRAAALIIRKHRLTEMFLVEKMSFGWEEVHDIAEQIEHIQSSAFFDKMDELLNYPDWDPHGAPIPDKKGNVHRREHKRLTDCQPGQEVILVAVAHSSNDFLKFLNSRNLKLGTEIHIITIEPFDGSMTVAYGKQKNEILSQKVSERLLVKG